MGKSAYIDRHLELRRELSDEGSLTSSFVIELTTEFLSHMLQSFYEFLILGLERLQVSGEIPQSFFLFRNTILLTIGELVVLKN